LISLGLVLIVAALDVSVLRGAPTLRLAISLITWLSCSLPVAVLIGHCALSEE
jgi:hypothetical protein